MVLLVLVGGVYKPPKQGPQMAVQCKEFKTETGPRNPVLKIKYHGYHGRGTKGIWGDQRDVYCFFCENIWETFWSSQNLYSVPSISVYGPHKIIVLSPQIQFIVPQKSLFCPLKFSL